VRVGSVELHPIVDAVGDLGALVELFPAVPADAWEPYRALYPDLFVGGTWRVPLTSYLLHAGGLTVLVDTAIGPPEATDWPLEHAPGLPAGSRSSESSRVTSTPSSSRTCTSTTSAGMRMRTERRSSRTPVT
jgi:hypothetical protein